MASLVMCRTCGGKASSEAVACPHCGDEYITEAKKRITEIKKHIEVLESAIERREGSLYSSSDFVRKLNRDSIMGFNATIKELYEEWKELEKCG